MIDNNMLLSQGYCERSEAPAMVSYENLNELSQPETDGF